MQPSEATNESNNEEKVIVRKRSVIPPNPSANYNCSLPSGSTRQVRKSQSGYTDGSPLPRHSSALKHQRSTLQVGTPKTEQRAPDQSYGYDQHYAPAIVAQTTKDSAVGPRNHEERIAVARDRCLQDFQQKKLRERKSFMLAPFQKRRASNIQSSGTSGYDTSLPPFNHAADGLLPPPPPPLPPEIPVTTSTIQTEKKTRNFSESLKGRFKKVFRRTSRVPSELPSQHVEGTHFYFATNSPLSTPGVRREKEEDPFTISYDSNHLKIPGSDPEDTSGRYSATGQSTARSRVTSWTNSTAAGTLSTRPDDDQHDSVDEQGRLKRSDSVSTLRKATSFFGRPIKNKLRKPSKAELQSSEESTGLYTALQEHIHSPQAAKQTLSEEQAADSRTSSALATLPSQRYADSTVGSKNQWPAPTIRSVTPDAVASRSDPLSPVTEVLSPESLPQSSTAQSKVDEEQYDTTPRSQLRRRPPVKAPTPSTEQIARRIERSKNRWQSPLDELSPPAPRASRAAMEDNPYELRSLSRSLYQSVASNDLPHHARVSEQPTGTRENVLSPSVYSRNTDGASPNPDTPAKQDHGGTMITITGREVKSYLISPKRPEQPVSKAVRHSQEWRRWLSDELRGWNSITTPQELALPSTILTSVEPLDADATLTSQQSDPESSGSGADSESPALDGILRASRGHRRKAGSRRPDSHMNDRYPMLETGRNSSGQTAKRTSRLSSRADSTPGSVMLGSESSAGQNSDAPVETSQPNGVITTGKVVPKHRSIATLRSVTRPSTALALATREDAEAESNTLQRSVAISVPIDEPEQGPDQAKKSSKKPKSAFDLRANYKNSANGRTKTLAVHRKAESNQNILMLEDNTIQNISAGPYASEAAIATSLDANKENTPPSETNNLPALSSSEWLAAGTNKKRETRKASAIHPAYGSRSVSRFSPSGTVTPVSPNGGGSSPGQRLVTNWLDGKKSKENSPAFV